MGLKDRYLVGHIVEDLQEKMVFVGGPRQVGKTTLATELVAKRFGQAAYFLWDDRSDRRRIIASDWPGDADLLILDEIHKYREWRRLLKGAYDKLKARYRFLVTGSARLDVYRRGGDSLQGRYHYYRLHPFSLAEWTGTRTALEPFQEIPIPSGGPSPGDLAGLETFGGFPEPLARQSARHLRRWHNERVERLFREDIRDLEAIRDLGSMQVLSDMLPHRVGSLLSANSLRQDLSVSHKTVSKWLDVLEAFHYHFRVRPHSKGEFRAVRKEPKLYLWDWSEVPTEAARFENLVASHLLKLTHYLRDVEGHDARLRFVRDRAGREVDFLVVVGERPWFAVEAKLAEEEPSPALLYFKDKLALPQAYQAIRKGGVDRLRSGVRIVSAERLLAALV